MTDNKASVEDKLDLLRKDTLNATVKMEQLRQKLDKRMDGILGRIEESGYSPFIVAGYSILLLIIGHISGRGL